MNGRITVAPTNAATTAVGAASAQVSSTLLAGKIYQFVSTTACWVKQGVGAQTAVVGAAGNQYVPANYHLYLHGSNGTNLSVIQDTAPGNAVLTIATEI